MRPYEVMVIFDATLEEDEIRALVDRFTQQLNAAGAKAVHTDSWGKRRLAYPVKHRNEGYYVVFEANAEPAAVSDLDRQLKLADEVVRHKVLRLPDQAAGRHRSRPAPSVDTTAVSSSANGESSPTVAAKTNGA
jgi:small subunit ribosomal protein S6